MVGSLGCMGILALLGVWSQFEPGSPFGAGGSEEHLWQNWNIPTHFCVMGEIQQYWNWNPVWSISSISRASQISQPLISEIYKVPESLYQFCCNNCPFKMAIIIRCIQTGFEVPILHFCSHSHLSWNQSCQDSLGEENDAPWAPEGRAPCGLQVGSGGGHGGVRSKNVPWKHIPYQGCQNLYQVCLNKHVRWKSYDGNFALTKNHMVNFWCLGVLNYPCIILAPVLRWAGIAKDFAFTCIKHLL